MNGNVARMAKNRHLVAFRIQKRDLIELKALVRGFGREKSTLHTYMNAGTCLKKMKETGLCRDDVMARYLTEGRVEQPRARAHPLRLC